MSVVPENTKTNKFVHTLLRKSIKSFDTIENVIELR